MELMEIRQRILRYRKEKGEALRAKGFEAQTRLLDDIDEIAMKYFKDTYTRWKKDNWETENLYSGDGSYCFIV
jgi:hypothetical protein